MTRHFETVQSVLDKNLCGTFRGRRYDTGKAVQVEVAGGILRAVTPIPEEENLRTLIPGLVDIQVNGGLGVEFSSGNLTVEEIHKLTDGLLTTGVGRFCPTLTTDTNEVLLHAAGTVRKFLDEYPDYSGVIAGIHLEGPFISAADGPRGAHRIDAIQKKYDIGLIDRIQEQSGNRLKIVTFSPEYEGVTPWVQALRERGIIPAIGHTSATSEQIAEAVQAGALLSTHLGNGAGPFFAKAGCPFFAQLINDQLSASVIADGKHLSRPILETIRRCKAWEKLILISDQSSAAGMPAGRYSTSLGEVEVLTNGRIVLAHHPETLAAASFPLVLDLYHFIEVTEMPLNNALALVTQNPARLLKIPPFPNDTIDFLAVGRKGSFSLIDFNAAPPFFNPSGRSTT